jgi:hypothetical protein
VYLSRPEFLQWKPKNRLAIERSSAQKRWERSASSTPESGAARKTGTPIQPFLNSEELIKFRYALASAARTGLDVARAGRQRQVRNEGVLRFPRSVGDEASVSMARRQFHRVQRFP